MATAVAKFQCDACGTWVAWRAELAGKRAKCKCGHVMTVPREAPPASRPTPREAAAVPRGMATVKPPPAYDADEYDLAPAPAPVASKPARQQAQGMQRQGQRAEAEAAALDRPVLPDLPADVASSEPVPGPAPAPAAVEMPNPYVGRKRLTEEEEVVVPPSPLRDVVLPAILIVAGVGLTFLDKQYTGPEGAMLPTGEVFASAVVQMLAGVALVIGATFLASAMAGIAFTEPIWMTCLKLAAVALPPAACGGLVLDWMGGGQNINASILAAFTSLGLYFGLFVLLVYRLPMSDVTVCVMLLWIIQACVRWAMWRAEGIMKGHDI